MIMKKYVALVRVRAHGTTTIIRTLVYADSDYQARLLVEQQYGTGNMIGSPTLVK
jgi:hypothetical protein